MLVGYVIATQVPRVLPAERAASSKRFGIYMGVMLLLILLYYEQVRNLNVLKCSTIQEMKEATNQQMLAGVRNCVRPLASMLSVLALGQAIEQTVVAKKGKAEWSKIRTLLTPGLNFLKTPILSGVHGVLNSMGTFESSTEEAEQAPSVLPQTFEDIIEATK